MNSDRPSIPYTYLIGWPTLNKWYYGVRYASGCHPNELWVSYKTSSIRVLELTKLHGDPPIREIRKTFKNSNSARLWEHRVLKRMKVIYDEKWINKTDNISIAPIYGDNNPVSRSEVREKIRNGVIAYYKINKHSTLGTTWNEAKKKEWSLARMNTLNPFYGHRHTEENLKMFSISQIGEKNSFYGKTHSDVQKAEWSKARKGICKSRICCIYCLKEVAINLFTRWHGNNCQTITE